MQGSAGAGVDDIHLSGAGALPARHYVLFGAVSTSTIAVLLLFMIGCASYMALENLPIVDAMYLTTGACIQARQPWRDRVRVLSRCVERCDARKSTEPTASASLPMRPPPRRL
jgi:hypothetical protein